MQEGQTKALSLVAAYRFGADHGLGEEVGDSEHQDEGAEQQFALEANLRDFLANNLSVLEHGLQLYRSGDRDGVEFSIGQGRIDILAVDKDDRFVVIELKLSRGRNKALGQLLYYMGCVDEQLGKGPCRGIIVASEIPDDLMTATRRAPGVSLFRYHISMTVEPVSTGESET